MVLFLWPFKVTKHYKNRGFSRHRGKPKWHFWLQKCHFGKLPRKGVLLSVIPESCVLLKTLKKRSFADMWECNLTKKQKFSKNRVACQNAKRCFFLSFFGFGGFVFFSLCFCAFAFYTIAQNGYFPVFLEVFRPFCSHERHVLNCVFSSYFVFLLLSSLSKIHFACLFETKFPNIPFFKPKLLSFLAVLFFSFCCSCFCFHGACFSLSVAMLALFLVIF